MEMRYGGQDAQGGTADPTNWAHTTKPAIKVLHTTTNIFGRYF